MNADRAANTSKIDNPDFQLTIVDGRKCFIFFISNFGLVEWRSDHCKESRKREAHHKDESAHKCQWKNATNLLSKETETSFHRLHF